MKSLLLLLLFIFPVFAFAQTDSRSKVIQLKGLKERITGSQRESLELLREKALDKLKKQALQQTVGEEVVSYDMLVKQENQGRTNDMFLSQVTTNLKGQVRNMKIVSETPSFDASHNLVLEIVADCEVLQYQTKPDPALTASITGVKPLYSEGEELVFSVTPARECFVKAFLISEVEGASSLLYPNPYEPSVRIEKEQATRFPLNPASFRYELSADKEQESDILFVVLLKEDFPFLCEPSPENILNWIFSIEPSQRQAFSYSFLIGKRKVQAGH